MVTSIISDHQNTKSEMFKRIYILDLDLNIAASDSSKEIPGNNYLHSLSYMRKLSLLSYTIIGRSSSSCILLVRQFSLPRRYACTDAPEGWIARAPRPGDGGRITGERRGLRALCHPGNSHAWPQPTNTICTNIQVLFLRVIFWLS